MTRLVLRATEYAHLLLSLVVQAGDTVLDATCGNGQDSCFLAALVGEAGRVWAFDLQPAACAATRALLAARGLAARVELVCADHAKLADYPLPPLRAAVFNLGYLPGGDQRLTTRAETTLAALDQALELLLPGGLLVVTAYPGHAAGAPEYGAIRRWLAGLPAERAASLELNFPQKRKAPRVLALEKIK